jgi:hypothetical protein
MSTCFRLPPRARRCCWRASYDRHFAVNHDHLGFSSASSRFSVSPLGVRRTDPTRRARADSPYLIEAGRRRTRSVAIKPRRRSGQTASPPPARPASSPRRGARTQPSPRVVSPRCINDGTAPMQAFNVQGAVSCRRLPHEHFGDGLHRRHHISKMCTQFSTAILLDEAAAALATRWRLNFSSSGGICAGRTLRRDSRATGFEVHRSRQHPHAAHRDRQIAELSFLAGVAGVSTGARSRPTVAVNITGARRIAPCQAGAYLLCRSNSESISEPKHK